MTENNKALLDRIGAEQVRAGYSNTAPGMSITAVCAVLIACVVAGSGAVTWTVALVFAGLMVGQISLRLVLIRTYLKRKPPEHEWRLWNRRFAIAALIASFILGIGSLWMLPVGRFDMQLLVMLFV